MRSVGWAGRLDAYRCHVRAPCKVLGVGLSHGTERFTWNEQPFLVQPSGRVLLIG